MPTIISIEQIRDIIDSTIDCSNEVFAIIDRELVNRSLEIGDLHKLYQMVYSTVLVEGEICNGGFCQYYSNPTAQEVNSLGIEGFRLIGANRTADVLQDVYKTILVQSPIFRMEHTLIGIQDAFNKATDVYDEIHIDEYDDQFYAAIEEEDITELRINYIKKVAANGWIE